MSNQVYSNERSKYYDYPGLNTYLMSGDQTVANLATEDIFFDTNDIINDPTIVENSTFVTQVLRDGMYCFSVNLDLQSETPGLAPNNKLEAIVSLMLDRPGQFVGLALQRWRNNYVEIPGNVSAQTIVPLSATFFCKTGDLVYYRVFNISGNLIKVLNSNSNLTINKIY